MLALDSPDGGGYGLELYRVYSMTAGTTPVAEARPDRCPEPCLISWVEPRIFWDHRDDLIEPRRGWWIGARRPGENCRNRSAGRALTF